MKHVKNPFTPTFGIVPPYLAGRDALLEEMAQAFEDGLGNPNLASIIVGARGTGKTALLSCIADEAQSQGWVSVGTIAAEGMLEDIVQQVGKEASHLLEARSSRWLSGLTVGQFLGLEWVFDASTQANWRSRMEALLDKLSQSDTGLLITVDEVRVSVEEMVQLVSTYQLFIRAGRKVSLVMAGLPTNVTDLISDERITFLRRARRRYLGRISDAQVELAFRKTVESAGKSIESQALDAAVRASRGFDYMMQLVGYCTWAEGSEHTTLSCEDVYRGIDLARKEFEHGVIETTYREMSKGDRAFARAMLPDANGSRLSDVASRMGKGTNYASTYKKRLLMQGVIAEQPGGTFDFEIPFMREYLRTCDD